MNYPDVDLKLVNDTPRWIVIEASYDESGILVRLLGAGPERASRASPASRKVTGPPKTEREPTRSCTWASGSSSTRASPRARSGSSGSSTKTAASCGESWYTHYRYEAKVVRVGTKAQPEPAALVPREDEKKPTEDAPTATGPGRRQLGASTPRSPRPATGACFRVGRGLRVHAGVRRPAVGDDALRLARPFDDVLEAKPSATEVGRADMDAQLVGESRPVEAGRT